jgi:TRAP-type C4-dicarboxylate transport system permease small subunit
MQVVDRLLRRIEYVTDTVAIIAMFTCMAVVSLDVFFRYALNSPTSWIVDVLVLYILPGIFFMGLPGSYAKGAHVAVDIILNLINSKHRLILSVVARFAAIGVFALLAWYGSARVGAAIRLGEIQPGTVVNWPLWPSVLLVPIGCGLAAIRAIERFAVETAALLNGREAIEEQVRATAHEEGLAQ